MAAKITRTIPIKVHIYGGDGNDMYRIKTTIEVPLYKNMHLTVFHIPFTYANHPILMPSEIIQQIMDAGVNLRDTRKQ